MADPALLATDLADYLVMKGVPFREAHHAVGAVVRLAEKHSIALDQLPLGELKQVHPRFAADWVKVFDLERALAKRTGTGMLRASAADEAVQSLEEIVEVISILIAGSAQRRKRGVKTMEMIEAELSERIIGLLHSAHRELGPEIS